MNNSQKKKIKNILCRLPPTKRLFAYKTRHTPRIFMYHRFTAAECNTGLVVSATNFEWQLKQLQGRWNVISLAEYVRLCRQKKEIPPYTVILTVDDGYRDFYEVAFPLLQKYKFPATFFATTSFVDGKIWLWHDRLHYALEHTDVSGIEFSLGQESIRLLTTTRVEKDATWQLLSDFCVEVSDEHKWQLIALLENKLQVDVPVAPPEDFAAASWDELREMAANGIEIGGHTVTHPVLSRLQPEKLQDELVGPKEIIEQKTGKVVETFCYPNGRDSDITPEVLNIIQEKGYQGAVQGSGINFSNLYRLPRMGVSNERLDFCWKLHGFEQLFMP